MKRIFIIIVILALVGGGVYFFGGDRKGLKGGGSQGGVRTDTVKVRDLKSYVSASGEVLPLMSSIVKSEISGRISELYVQEGDSVKEGQLLLELDRTSLETRLRESERRLEADTLLMEKAKRNFVRLNELYAKKFVGEKDFLDAQTDYELAQLNLEIAQTRVDESNEDLSKAAILAPHDGIITLLDIVDGQVISGATSVSNGTELMTLSQLRELYLEANINEIDVASLDLNQEVSLRFDAIPNMAISGKIGEIALSARRDGNVRVFPIKVIFEAMDSGVRPGISAKVEIPIAEANGVVSVLLSAVFMQEQSSFVYVKDAAGNWEKRVVQAGINDLQHVEIKEGLMDGDIVALRKPAEFRNTDD
jgi:HlyD family secretion protein